MDIKTIAAGAAIALAAATSSASAGDQYRMLDGVTAVAMTSGAMAAVVGSVIHFDVNPLGHTFSESFDASRAGTGRTPNPNPGSALQQAETVSNGVIVCIGCPT